MDPLKQSYWQCLLEKKRFENKVKNWLRLWQGRSKHNVLRTFWFEERKNFGDLFTPLFIKHAGYTAVNGTIEKAQMFATGSIIQLAPESFSGTIIGSGIIKEQHIRLPKANILSVRGLLTKKCLGIEGDMPLGDPGLIACDFIEQPQEQIYDLGVVAHYVDKNLPAIAKLTRLASSRVKIIDVEQSALQVTHQIAQCKHIVSSSLHGIIVADSLDIPCAWIIVSEHVIGNGFKFSDYRSAFGEQITPLKIDGSESIDSLISATSSRDHNVTKKLQGSIRQVFQQYFESLKNSTT